MTQTSTSPAAPFSIVVGLDFTDAGGYAFAQAVRMVRKLPKSALHLVHVFDQALARDRAKELVDHLRLYANEKSAAFGGLSNVTFGIHLRAGKPVREMVQLAGDVGADLIVIGAHKRPHMRSWIVGSTAERLIAAAPCPVLVAGPQPDVAEAHEPAIDPPCPDCLRTRAETKGQSFWCARHAEHAVRGHTFSYQREIPFAEHDSEVIPTGVGF